MNNKILYISNIPAPYNIKFFSLLGEKYDLTVLYERNKADNRNENWYCEDSNGYRSVFLDGIKFGDEMAFCPSVLKYLSREYKHIIVGDYSSPTGILAIEYMRINNIKFYIHTDGGIKGEKEGLKFYIKKHLMSSASYFFSSGNKTDEYIKNYAGNNAKIKHYIFSSIENSYILDYKNDKKVLNKRNGKINGLHFSDEKPLLISVGSLIYRKGFDLLIKAIQQNKLDVELVIVGGKANNSLLKIINADYNEKIHFIDFVSPKEVKRYLECADLFVMPTRYDIWGLVINEAMGAGLPCVSSDMCVAGLELIKNGYNGFLFESENIIDLSGKLKKWLSLSDEEKIKMKINAIETSKKYTIENKAKSYIDALASIEEEM